MAFIGECRTLLSKLIRRPRENKFIILNMETGDTATSKNFTIRPIWSKSSKDNNDKRSIDHSHLFLSSYYLS